MNPFEKILLGILSAAPSTIPVFVHSPQGIAIVNASEILLAAILAQFHNPAPPAPPANPPAA